ncbi:ComEC/Rec2 family competence protein, partial [Actinotalea ferrariae]|uniref:ComEC/Rec2 family competence protein n=1 Tax=Actinotalea ferrariae TaxID=1386098 RepID=UPI001C8CA323
MLAGSGLVLVVVALLLAGAGVQLHVRERSGLASLAADRAVVTVVGVVRADARPVASPWPSDDGDRRWAVAVSVVAVEGRGRSGPGGGAAVVLGDGRWAGVPVGSTVRATGRSAPAEPGDEGVASVSVWEAPVVVARAGAVDAVVDGLRTGLLDVSADLPGDARGLVPGAAVGDTSRVADDLDAAMRTSGLTHVTAVSGGHFAVLGAAVLGATGRLPRRVRALVCAAVMAAFILLVRPEPSVVRAAGMGAVALVGLLAGRRSRALPALGATVVVLLALDPWLARSFGFVLSVVATGAIVLLAPPLAARLPAAVPRWLALALAVPVAAQAACAPVLVLLDPVVSVYAVPANLLAAPAMAPATLLGLAATVAAPLAPPLGHALAVLAGVPCSWVGLVARAAAGLEGARAPWPGGVGGALLLAAVTSVALAVVLRRRAPVPPWVAATTAVALVLSVPAVRVPLLGLLPGGWPPPGWRVVLCDVAQGDALAVRTGPDSAVVVDVGPDGDAADACLDALGVRRVDLLVLTHHHADHVGGLAPVLEGREVVRALVSPVPEPAGQARRTLEALGAAGVPVDVGVTGTTGAAGDVGWTVLWP